MKKTILLITIMVFLMSTCGAATLITKPVSNTIGNTIIFHPKPNPGRPQPRSVAFVPVTGIYDYSSQCVRLNFMDNIGEMTVTIINHSTGEQSFEFVDSAFESAEVYVSSDEGQYSISIEAQDGSSYYAEFIIS